MLALLQQLQGGAPPPTAPPTAPPPAAALPEAAPPAAAPPPTAAPPVAAPFVAGEPSAELSVGDDAPAPSDGAKHPKTMLTEFVAQRPQLGGLRALVFEVLEDAGPQAPYVSRRVSRATSLARYTLIPTTQTQRHLLTQLLTYLLLCLLTYLPTCLLTTAGAAALPGGRAARHAAAEQLPRQEPEAGEHGRGAAGSGRARV